MHQGAFARGRGRFHPIEFAPQREEPDEEYPLILSTGRTLYHYNVGNMTRKSAVATQQQSTNFVELHPATAERHGVRHGDLVEVQTRRGSVIVRAEVGRKLRPDTIWMPFHFAEAPTNKMTNDVFDPVTRTAEYKCCAARIRQVEAEEPADG